MRPRRGSSGNGGGRAPSRGKTSGKMPVRAAARKTKVKTNGSSAPAIQEAVVPQFDAQSFLMSVGTGRSTKKYATRKTIFQQGDPADAVFYIQKGKVKLTVVSKQGREGVIAILSAGDFFGEGCLAGRVVDHPRQRRCLAALVRIEWAESAGAVADRL